MLPLRVDACVSGREILQDLSAIATLVLELFEKERSLDITLAWTILPVAKDGVRESIAGGFNDTLSASDTSTFHAADSGRDSGRHPATPAATLAATPPTLAVTPLTLAATLAPGCLGVARPGTPIPPIAI